MVWQLLEMLSAGETTDEILQAFPALTKNHIRAALSYAAQALAGDRLVRISLR